MLYALCSMLSTFFAPIPCVSSIAHFASLHIAFPKTPGRLILHSLFNYVLPYALCSMLYALCSLLSAFFAPIPCVSSITHFASLNIALPKTPGRLILLPSPQPSPSPLLLPLQNQKCPLRITAIAEIHDIEISSYRKFVAIGPAIPIIQVR